MLSLSLILTMLNPPPPPSQDLALGAASSLIQRRFCLFVCIFPFDSIREVFSPSLMFRFADRCRLLQRRIRMGWLCKHWQFLPSLRNIPLRQEKTRRDHIRQDHARQDHTRLGNTTRKDNTRQNKTLLPQSTYGHFIPSYVPSICPSRISGFYVDAEEELIAVWVTQCIPSSKVLSDGRLSFLVLC